MRLTILAAGALLPLAACSQGPSTEESARQTGVIQLENASMEDVAKQSAAAEAKAPGQSAGQWEEGEQLVALEAGGAPEEKVAPLKAEIGKPPRMRSGCRTAQDVKPFDVTQFPAMQSVCRFPKFSSKSGKVDAVMECTTPAGPSRVSITGTQGPNAYDLTMKRSMTMPGQTKESSMTIRLTGKRLGACKA